MSRPSESMIGNSAALAQALDHLSRLAPVNRPILVLGERGTGKELAAERLHFLSTRWDAPLLKVNCAAMAETLLESELFGHEAGAFTGATRSHQGRFERADGGTLFLDELGTMSMRLQEKLLRLVEYGEFERVGGQETLQVDVRVIAATNADLRALAARGEFRHDLLDRLSFDIVHLPALRHRREDIPELAEHFAIQMSAELGWELFPGFTREAMAALQAYQWPGNVRELKNLVQRVLILGAGDEITQNEVETALGSSPPVPTQPLEGLVSFDQPLRQAREQFEKAYLEYQLGKHAGNVSKMAKEAGMERTHLYRKLRSLGIEIKERR